MKFYKDENYNFIEIFNEKNGTLVRSNILNNSGHETAATPFKRTMPELIDIGIMGHCNNKLTCRKFGVDCYQGYENDEDMPIEKYVYILNQIKESTFQVALGGRGDPNKHPQFEEILKVTKKYGIIPNITTSGYDITNYEIDLISKYCGAVAVSFYSKINKENMLESNPHTIEIINKLCKNNITNIHYVVSNDSIDDLIFRLKMNLFPEGINGIILLLYKNVGLGRKEKVLNDETKIKTLFDCIKNYKKSKIGFDSCFSIYVNKYISDVIDKASIIPCEAGRFSCYIDSNLKMYPCSFIKNCNFSVDLKKRSIYEGWFSKEFELFAKLNCKNIFECPLKLNLINKKQEKNLC